MYTEKERAIYDYAYGLGIRAGWNASSRTSTDESCTFLGKSVPGISSPDYSILKKSDEMMLEARKILYQKAGKKHKCPEWDGLEINEQDPEFEACLCYSSGK